MDRPRGRGRPIKHVPVDELRAWRMANWSMAELAYGFSVSRPKIEKVLRESGGNPIARRKVNDFNRTKEVSKQVTKEIIKWRAKGWKLRELGYAFGMTRQGIDQRLKGSNVWKRKRVEIGLTFWRLTVIAEAERGKKGERFVLCQCVCGKEKVIGAYSLGKGENKTKSCGCLQKENSCKSKRRLITIDGRTQHLQAWINDLEVNQRTVRLRVEAGWSWEQALTRPMQNGRRLDGKEKKRAK